MTRAAAARAVDLVFRSGVTLDRATGEAFAGIADRRDIATATAFAFGTLRFHCRHRLIIERLLDRPLRSRDAVLTALLSVGLYQLCHARQPDYAAVSATVAAAKLLKRSSAAGLVNATLRRFLRERDAITKAVLETDEGRFSHPQWIIERLRADWPGHVEPILCGALEQPPMWIRVNRCRVSRDEYRARLAAAGIGAAAQPGFDAALRLDRAVDVGDLPGFEAGDASVQDAASQLAAPLLGAEPGMRVLDACAAPGGKASHLLEFAGGELDVLALDIDTTRLARVDDNFRRLGFAATTRVGDATSPDAWFDGRAFDRILVDAPCSASGVIRRHPDIMFLRREGDIEALAGKQAAMLEALWSLLKPGGRLLYSTCSLFRAENDRVVTRFLATRSDAVPVTMRAPADDAPVVSLPGDRGLQCLPGAGGIDGIYYALMTRQS